MVTRERFLRFLDGAQRPKRMAEGGLAHLRRRPARAPAQFSSDMSFGDDDPLVAAGEYINDAAEERRRARENIVRRAGILPLGVNELGDVVLDFDAGVTGEARRSAETVGRMMDEGVPLPSDMTDEEFEAVFNAAGIATTGGLVGDAPVGALAAGLSRKDPRLYHDASRIKLRMPLDEMEFGFTETPGALQAARTLDIAELEGRTLVPAYGDRTRAGGILHSINGDELDNPVVMQGGPDFMRSGGGAWASEPPMMRSKAAAVQQIADENQEAPVLVYTAMGAQGGDFSRMMSDAIMGQIRPSMANAIDPRAVEAYDAKIRALKNPNGNPAAPNWPGILSPDAREYISNLSGTTRRELWQEMDRAAYRNAGFPDVGATRLAITEPGLYGAQPFDTGRTIAQLPERVEVTPTPADVHSTYGARISGDYIGGLSESVPGEMIWRDFFRARREVGAPPASDQRSFMMKPTISQRVDAQMVDDVSRYLEQQRQRQPRPPRRDLE